MFYSSRFACRRWFSQARAFVVKKQGTPVSFHSALSDQEAVTICRSKQSSFAQKVVAQFDEGDRREFTMGWIHYIAVGDTADATKAATPVAHSCRQASRRAPSSQSFTIKTKGEEITFESTLTDDEAALLCRKHGSSFANDLLDKFDRGDRKNFVVGWIHYIAMRHGETSQTQSQTQSQISSQARQVNQGETKVRSFTIKKKGEEITFDSTLTDEEAVDICRASNLSFANKLVTEFDEGERKSSLIGWIHQIATNSNKASSSSIAYQNRNQSHERHVQGPTEKDSSQTTWVKKKTAESIPEVREFRNGTELLHDSEKGDYINTPLTDDDAFGFLSNSAYQTDFMQSLVEAFPRGWSSKRRFYAHKLALSKYDKRSKNLQEVRPVSLGPVAASPDESSTLKDALENRNLQIDVEQGLGVDQVRVDGKLGQRLLVSEVIRWNAEQTESLTYSDVDFFIVEGRASPLISVTLAPLMAKGTVILFSSSPDDTAVVLAQFMRHGVAELLSQSG